MFALPKNTKFHKRFFFSHLLCPGRPGLRQSLKFLGNTNIFAMPPCPKKEHTLLSFWNFIFSSSPKVVSLLSPLVLFFLLVSVLSNLLTLLAFILTLAIFLTSKLAFTFPLSLPVRTFLCHLPVKSCHTLCVTISCGIAILSGIIGIHCHHLR